MPLAAPIPLLTPIARADADSRPLLASVIGADYSALALTPQSSDHAPDVVRAALPRFGTWNAQARIDLTRWRVIDYGDAHAREAGTADDAWHRLYDLATTAHAAARPVFAFGGDHSVTWPLVTAARDAVALHSAVADGGERAPRIGVIQFDVHHDVRPIDAGPSNGTPIRGLIERGVIDATDVVQIGIHPLGNRRELTEYCDAHGIHRLSLADVRNLGVAGVVEHVRGRLADCDALYLTIDIDVLERASAPGTGAALAGALEPWMLAALVAELSNDARVVGLDVVEFDPARDVADITAYAVANVVVHALTGLALACDHSAGSSS